MKVVRYAVGVRVGFSSPAFAAFIPDLPECTGRGETLEQAVGAARAAAKARIAELLNAGRPLPVATDRRELFDRTEYRGCFWEMVELEAGPG